MVPSNLIFHSIHFGIMFGACQSCSILFDNVDFLPSTWPCKCYRITSSASKDIDEYILWAWSCCRQVLSDFALRRLVVLSLLPWRNITYSATGSGVTPNQATSVIQIPWSYSENTLYLWAKYLYRKLAGLAKAFWSSLLNIVRHFASVLVMMASFGWSLNGLSLCLFCSLLPRHNC